nr:hypothetical protein [Bacillus mesophilus]
MAKIGKDLKIAHSVGIVIGAGTSVGKNLSIYQNVTIGSKIDRNGKAQYPIIGDNVTLYPGCVVIGNITIGDDAVVAPNAVVIKDVPSKTVAMGIPAIIKSL